MRTNIIAVHLMLPTVHSVQGILQRRGEKGGKGMASRLGGEVRGRGRGRERERRGREGKGGVGEGRRKGEGGKGREG